MKFSKRPDYSKLAKTLCNKANFKAIKSALDHAYKKGYCNGEIDSGRFAVEIEEEGNRFRHNVD